MYIEKPEWLTIWNGGSSKYLSRIMMFRLPFNCTDFVMYASWKNKNSD